MSDSAPGVHVVSDQVYSCAGGVQRLADVYLPASSEGPFPVVIWLHGGGWRFGDRRMAPDLALFAQGAGVAVVSIDYRLSDEAKFPAPVEDVKTAVRWVRSVAEQFKFNRERIGLWGSSAGAHLAAMVALSPHEMFATDEHAGFSNAVQAVVDGYGPMDFSRIDADRAAVQKLDTDAESFVIRDLLPAGDPDSFESRLIGAPVGSSQQLVEAANPVRYVRAGNPPFLILHGEADTAMPWQQSGLLFEALDSVGDDATLVLFEKLTHGFFNNRQLDEVDCGAVTVRRSRTDKSSRERWSCDAQQNIPGMVEDFLRAHLAGRG